MAERVLVTGRAGFIGSHLADVTAVRRGTPVVGAFDCVVEAAA